MTASTLLSYAPNPFDFVLPSRSPRKLSFVVSWLILLLAVPAIVSLCSVHWSSIDTRETLATTGGVAEMRTVAHYSLVRYWSVTTTTVSNSSSVHASGSISSLSSLGPFSSTSLAALGILVASVALSLVSCLATFYYGWARFASQRLSYVSACGSLFVVGMLSLLGFIVYVAGMPKSRGFGVSWGGWLDLAVAILQLVLCLIVVADKPAGLVRLDVSSRKLIKDESGPCDSSTFGASSGGGGRNLRAVPTAVDKVQGPPPGKERLVRALYDCTPDQRGDLSFKAGDVFTIVSDNPGNGWKTGRTNAGTEGIFPVNYVELL